MLLHFDLLFIIYYNNFLLRSPDERTVCFVFGGFALFSCVDAAPVKKKEVKSGKKDFTGVKRSFRNPTTLSPGADKSSRVRAVFHRLKVFHAGAAEPLSLPLQCLANMAAFKLAHQTGRSSQKRQNNIITRVC